MSLRDSKSLGNILALLLTFIISGIWHGSNWTFIIWGVLNALYFIPSFFSWKRYKNKEIVAQGKYFPSIREFFQMGCTFLATVFAWIFFRSDSIGQAVNYITRIFSMSFFTRPEIMSGTLLLLIVVFVIIEWIGREQHYAIEHFGLKWPRPLRWGIYYCIIIAIFYFAGEKQQFIYFQF
jgi:D-alanyl-lipoteichoic acid acyltransferase DltB (MBOAT superfamily)